MARVERQVAGLEARDLAFVGGAGEGVGAGQAQAREQFVQVVAAGKLQALVLGGAQVGPAHGVADVLQLMVEVDVEQRGFAAPFAIVVAGADLVGLGLFRLKAVGRVVA
ncbi:hypothetical protein D3C78_1710780 [compost metagenome]